MLGRHCPRGHRGERAINNLVSFSINGATDDVKEFINGKLVDLDSYFSYSINDGKLVLSFDISEIEKKHNIRDFQISVLYGYE